MPARFAPHQIGKRHYFALFGVGQISDFVGGAMWVAFDGYRVAFDSNGRHVDIRVD